jgi:NADH dehydrogenase FAD-containing subunit
VLRADRTGRADQTIRALIPDSNTGNYLPPTAQHALREGKVLAHNVLGALKGAPAKPFTFSTIRGLAAIRRRTGVANILGFKFSGFFAWCLWRTIYLSKLRGLRRGSASLWTGRWTCSSPQTSSSL